ncbi:MAG: tail fiber domain-containing protein [Chitinophagales bacterium]
MFFSFKKMLYSCCFLLTLLFLSDSLFAQKNYRSKVNRTNSVDRVNTQVGGGNCCRDENGNCINKETREACSGVTNCLPCKQQSTQAPTGWNIGGAGVACSECPTCNDCLQNLIFKAPLVNNILPLYVDKGGQTYINKARIAGNFEPTRGGAFNLGSSKTPFKAVYARKLVGQVSKYSDRRLKTNISELPYGLQTVMDLKPSIYHYKNDTEGKKDLGLIAQDLQQTVPEVVDESGEFLSVDYAALVPVLIQAIQEQQAIIETQKSTIEVQKTAMEETQTELKDLKVNLDEVMNFLQLKEEKVGDVNE